MQALVQRIAAEQGGRLDLLVNDVWGGDRLTEWGTPFWRHSLTGGLDMLHNGVDSHLITSWHAVPLMLARGSGLIVGMTDGHTADYRDSLFYDLVKSSVIRLAVSQGSELSGHGITAVALTPGWIRSERILEREGVSEDNWQDAYRTGQVARGARGWLASESPSYVGRAVVALAADPDVTRWNGQVLTSWDLADEYGFTDLNNTRPRFEDRTVEILDTSGNHLRRDDYSDTSRC